MTETRLEGTEMKILSCARCLSPRIAAAAKLSVIRTVVAMMRPETAAKTRVATVNATLVLALVAPIAAMIPATKV